MIVCTCITEIIVSSVWLYLHHYEFLLKLSPVLPFFFFLHLYHVYKKQNRFEKDTKYTNQYKSFDSASISSVVVAI